MMVLVFVLVVALAVTVATSTPRTEVDAREARTILDLRLARGDLSPEDHRHRAAQLDAVPTARPRSRGVRVLAITAALGLTVAGVVSSTQSMNDRMDDMMNGQNMMNGMDMMGDTMGFGWIAMVILLVATVGLIVWVVRRLTPTGPGGVGSDDARHILDTRYARGEIDGDEYAERREALGR